MIRERMVRLADEHPEVLKRLLALDFAELELRVAAWAGSPVDPHVRAAAELFGISDAEVTPEQRKVGKVFNHFFSYANIYGGRTALEDLNAFPKVFVTVSSPEVGRTVTGRRRTGTETAASAAHSRLPRVPSTSRSSGQAA